MPAQQKSGTVLYCLLLKHAKEASVAHKSYVGITNNFLKRLRQHNREITGGARYTGMYRKISNARWKPLYIIKGFRSRRFALQFEYRLHKRETVPASFLNSCGRFPSNNRASVRANKLYATFALPRVVGKAPLTSTMGNFTVYWYNKSLYQTAIGLSYWPPYVRHKFIIDKTLNKPLVKQRKTISNKKKKRTK